MRTKTLLLTAALAVAGIASSKAQVYSVNAVGYVNTTLVPGFSLVSNPLDNKAGNKVGDLFKNVTPSIPNNLTVYVFKNGGFLTAQYDDIEGGYLGAAAAESLDPGNGAFVRNPSQTTLTCTFVGEVVQGQNLSNPIPAGFSIKASQVPQGGTTAELNVPAGANGDKIFKWNKTTQSYETSTFDDIENNWLPAVKPLEVGEAFFIFSKNGTTWTRSFSVNG